MGLEVAEAETVDAENGVVVADDSDKHCDGQYNGKRAENVDVGLLPGGRHVAKLLHVVLVEDGDDEGDGGDERQDDAADGK